MKPGASVAVVVAARAVVAALAAFAPLVASCGGSGSAGVVTSPTVSAPRPPAPAPVRCPSALDVRDLLARHARAFGSPEAVAAALPIVLTGTVSLEGKTGTIEDVLTKDAYRSQALVAGVYGGNGVDARGPWVLDGGSGVLERLRPDEAIDPRLEEWTLRRSYVTAFDPSRDTARCVDAGGGGAGGARVDVTFARPELGSPTLALDLESASLLSVAHAQSDGKPFLLTIEAWGEPDRGVRWPRRLTDHPVAGSSPVSELTTIAHELACVRFDATGVAIPQAGEACASPPPDRLTLTWPEQGVVRVPMTFHGGELFVRARIGGVGGREVWALLDSGASITTLDATSPAGAAFQPALAMSGAGATQKVRFGVGELPSIEIGGLRAEHVPTASVPIPALDSFGDRRPELILGYSFFVAGAVRVDYTQGLVAFARTSDGLFRKGVEARAVPLRALKSKLVAEGSVDGAAASFEVDTGNAGGLDLYKKWATAHGLPGARPSVAMKGRFGVGADETTSIFFRVAKASLGPIRFDDRVAHVSDPPDPGFVAGLAGNEVLARCDAIVIDHAKRTLFLEGPCERPAPERRVGWRLEKRPDPAHEGRPWVVGAIFPGSAAERAGARTGDRLIEIAGKPATGAIEAIWAVETQPEGTKVPVTLARRGGEKVRIVIELRGLLR